MHKISIDMGLILWQILIFALLLFFVVGIVILITSKKIEPKDKIVWLVGFCVLPFLTPIIYMVKYISNR